jgi:hypothetical protein
MIADKIAALLADRGYDADYIAKIGAEAALRSVEIRAGAG